MTLTPGRLRALKAVSNPQGIIAALAMDRRGSLQKALGGSSGKPDLEGFKTAVTEALTPYASAVLLDPEWGLAAAKHRAKRAGLLLAYEKPVMTLRSRVVSPICSVSGRSADSRKLEPIV
jgi:tagatose 1,6-diphosphate aldolase